MPNLPDIGNMAPDEFLSRLEDMRDELVDEMAEVLAEVTAPDDAVEAFEALFEEYALGDAEADPEPLVEVHRDEDRLVFGREGVEREVIVVRDGDRWREAGDGPPRDPKRLAFEILRLVPWWQEGAFAGKVGRPEDYGTGNTGKSGV